MDPVVAFDLHGQALFGEHVDGVAVTDAEGDAVAVLLHAVAHAHEFQGPAVTFGYADDGVGDQRPGQAVERVMELALGQPLNDDLPVFHLDGDFRVVPLDHLAARAGDFYAAVQHLHLDTIGYRYGLAPDTRQRLFGGWNSLGDAGADRDFVTRHNRPTLLRSLCARPRIRSSFPGR